MLATLPRTTLGRSPSAEPADRLPLSFELDADHEATQPPEAEGRSRGDVRLLVSPGHAEPIHRRFVDLPEFLSAGDLVVVNTSATVPAAIDVEIDDSGPAVIHVSTELPGELWMVEPRLNVANGSTVPLALAGSSATVTEPGTGSVLLHLLRPAPRSRRLWLAVPGEDVDLRTTMNRQGRAIRYRYVPRDWPLAAYQTVFATEPGSAEMPSAARPFTAELVTRLVSQGIAIAPITLHTGVSSLEAGEQPYVERYRIPVSTASMVNATHRTGGRVVAAGTTVVRALETATDESGTTHPNDGWTDVVITPDRGVRAVDALLTGWHEPEATHLAMLQAVAGRQPLIDAYEAAYAGGYLWHEFGDSHLIIPYA